MLIADLCNCPEIQDKHLFNVGDKVYNNGMIESFSRGATKGVQNCDYMWNQCADKYRRIPSRKDLMRFAKTKRRALERKGCPCHCEPPEINWILNWIYGGYIFNVDKTDCELLNKMVTFEKSGQHPITISKKGRKFGFDHLPYPPITYFYTWIPTQEQIQLMMKHKLDCTGHNIRELFWEWYNSKYTCDKQHWTDQELWIVFYMFTVHKKTLCRNKWKGLRIDHVREEVIF